MQLINVVETEKTHIYLNRCLHQYYPTNKEHVCCVQTRVKTEDCDLTKSEDFYIGINHRDFVQNYNDQSENDGSPSCTTR